MPTHSTLKELAEPEIEPTPPSWVRVIHLLIKHRSPDNSNLGAVMAASGEVSIFSYAKDSVEPMYYSTIGGDERLKLATGCELKRLRTTNAEEAYTFIREGIDSGSGVFMPGPEVGLCYGYNDSGPAKSRVINAYSNWGPALNGNVPWEFFASQYIPRFGNAEGLAYIRRITHPESAESILKMLAETVIDWQTQHPAVQFGMQQSYYGVPAFRQFIKDLRDPGTRSEIDGAYINCHAILFQQGGRYWLGEYLKELASQLTGPVQKHLDEIGTRYLAAHTELKRFMDFDITRHQQEQAIQDAIDGLQRACQLDEEILEAFIALRNDL